LVPNEILDVLMQASGVAGHLPDDRGTVDRCHLILGIGNRPEACDSRPGVDEIDTGRLEVADVPGSERCSPVCDDASDVNVSDLYRPAASLPFCGNDSRGESRSLIENLDAAVEFVDKQSGEVSLKLAATTTVLQKVYAGADFEDSDRGGPNGYCWLIMPLTHFLLDAAPVLTRYPLFCLPLTHRTVLTKLVVIRIRVVPGRPR
jgi:hypothetical protein